MKGATFWDVFSITTQGYE